MRVIVAAGDQEVTIKVVARLQPLAPATAPRALRPCPRAASARAPASPSRWLTRAADCHVPASARSGRTRRDLPRSPPNLPASRAAPPALGLCSSRGRWDAPPGLEPNLEPGPFQGRWKSGGKGLGLPIARLYAKYFGGSLYLTPVEGYGTDCCASGPPPNHLDQGSTPMSTP
jgi:hypothetical protein